MGFVHAKLPVILPYVNRPLLYNSKFYHFGLLLLGPARDRILVASKNNVQSAVGTKYWVLAHRYFVSASVSQACVLYLRHKIFNLNLLPISGP